MNKRKTVFRSGHSDTPQMLDRMAALGLLAPMLSELGDEKLRMVLSLRHGSGMDWPAVRAELKRRGLFYSDRQIFRLYAKAVAAIEERWRGGA